MCLTNALICNMYEQCFDCRVVMGADMAAISLLDLVIDQKHRAAYLEADPQGLEPLQTRTPKKNWLIHPGWIDRYVFNCFVSIL